MKSPKLAAVIFTYPKDYEAAGYAARALRNCGARVYLAIDSKDPKIHIDGGQVIRTHFPRGGNLNGIECMTGILDTLAAVQQEKDQWLLKVDSDTIVHSLAWLKVDPAFDLVGTGHDPAKNDGRTLYGCCYAIRPKGLEALRAKIVETGTKKTKCEDLMLGNAGEALGVLRRYILHEEGHMGPHLTRFSVDELMRRYQAICVQRTGKHSTARAEVVEKMAELYAHKWPE